MDDEQPRPGVKIDLTAMEDGYLSDGFGGARRFTKLSESGHDLTPLSEEELAIEVSTFISKAVNAVLINRLL